ncbi:hypothetical protein OJE16_19680 [Pantoea tagorei]
MSEQLKAAEAEWRKANPGKEPTANDISGQAYLAEMSEAIKNLLYGNVPVSQLS